MYFRCVEVMIIDLHQKINTMVNEYYFKKINKITNIVNKLSFIDDLIKDGYPEWKLLLIQSTIKCDIVNFEPKMQIELIENIYKKYSLDIGEIICLLFNIIDITYSNYFKLKNTMQIMFCLMFWNNLIVKSTNEYSFDVFKIKTGLDKYIKISHMEQVNVVTQPKECILEKFLCKILSSKFPKDFLTHDDLFIYK